MERFHKKEHDAVIAGSVLVSVEIWNFDHFIQSYGFQIFDVGQTSEGHRRPRPIIVENFLVLVPHVVRVVLDSKSENLRSLFSIDIGGCVFFDKTQEHQSK